MNKKFSSRFIVYFLTCLMVFSVFLVSCGKPEPKLDASTKKTFQESTKKILDGLETQKEKVEFTSAMSRIAIYKGLQLASSEDTDKKPDKSKKENKNKKESNKIDEEMAIFKDLHGKTGKQVIKEASLITDEDMKKVQEAFKQKLKVKFQQAFEESLKKQDK